MCYVFARYTTFRLGELHMGPSKYIKVPKNKQAVPLWEAPTFTCLCFSTVENVTQKKHLGELHIGPRCHTLQHTQVSKST